MVVGWSELNAPTLDAFRDDRDRLEHLVISALLWWRPVEIRERAAGLLTSDDFAHGRWRTMFAAIVDLLADRRDLDAAELVDALGWDRLETVGGLGMVSLLLDDAYPGGSPVVFAELLADWARRDRLMTLVSELPGQVRADELDPDLLAERISADMPDRQRGIDYADDMREEILDRIADPDGDRGLSCGLSSLDRLYRVAPGLWTVVTGLAGSGKSTLVDGMAVSLAERCGWRFAVFSAESAPTDRHALMLARMRLGGPVGSFSISEVTGAVDWVHDHFAWIRSTEELTVTEILRRADVIGRRRHLDGLIVDPFNEVDRGDSRESETLRISEEITRIRRWARRRQAHVWVVAHPRKLERRASGEYATPTLYDIAHSATFRDKADMGLVVERPRKDPFADTTIHVGKVRFQPQHGREGAAQVTFSSSAQRFTSETRPL